MGGSNLFILFILFLSSFHLIGSFARKTQTLGGVSIYDSSVYNDFYSVPRDNCSILYNFIVTSSDGEANVTPHIDSTTSFAHVASFDMVMSTMSEGINTTVYSLAIMVTVGRGSIDIDVKTPKAISTFPRFYSFNCENAPSSRAVVVTPYTFSRSSEDCAPPYFSSLYQIVGPKKPIIFGQLGFFDNFYNSISSPKISISFAPVNINVQVANNLTVELLIPFSSISVSPVEMISFTSWVHNSNSIRDPQHMASKLVVRATSLGSFNPYVRSMDTLQTSSEVIFAAERVGQEMTFMSFPPSLLSLVPIGTQLSLQALYMNSSLNVVTDKALAYKLFPQSFKNGVIIDTFPRNTQFITDQVLNISTHGNEWHKWDLNILASDQDTYLFSLNYPFSFKNGSASLFFRGFSIPLQYNRLPNWCFKSRSKYFQEYTQCVNGAAVLDTINPYLKSLRFTALDDNYYLATAKVYDEHSGFLKAVGLKSKIVFSYRDLIDGTINNGTYQFVVLRNDIGAYLSAPIQIYDRASNYYSFKINSLADTNFYDIFPQTPPLLSDIVDVYFKYNNVDLSNSGIKNTIYLKVKEGVQVTYYFIPIINTVRSLWISDMEKKDSIPFFYDPETRLYSAEFYIPARPVSTFLDYNIIGFPQGTISNRELIYLENSQFKFSSNKGDELPPLVTSIVVLPTSVNTISSKQTIGWTITIQDSINGFKQGMVKVVSDLDIGGVNFTLSNNRGDIYNAVFDVTFEVLPNCANQTYRIEYMYAEDLLGYSSQYDPSKEVGDLTPLIQINDMSQYNNKIICLGERDSIPPKLLDLTFDLPPVNIRGEGSGRAFQITISTRDDVAGISTRHPPTLYLMPTIMEIIPVQCQYKSSQGDVVDFICAGSIPYMFGLNSYIYFSVYGITDNQMNFRGYSVLDLMDVGLGYYLPTTLGDSMPFITGTTKVSYQGGVFIVNGRNFVGSLSLEINFQNQTGSSYVNVPISMSSAVAIKVILPRLTNPFNIRVVSNSIVSNILFLSPTGTPFVPLQCLGDPVCGGETRGSCTPAGCLCILPYTGIDCLSQIVKIEPTIDPEKPNIGLNTSTSTNIDGKTVSYSSLVSIRSIHELNQFGVIVESFDLKEWTLKSLSNNSLYQYNTTFSPMSTRIQVDIQYFKENSLVAFADRVLDIPSQTLKYSITLSPYPFKSQLNTLQLVMAAELFQNETNIGCSNSEFTNSIESQLIKLQLNDHILLGRFIDISIVDNRITQITNSILTKTDNSPSTTSALIGINLPYYKNNIVCDPDFSVLVDTVDASKKEGSICNAKENSKSGLTKAQLIGIIVGSVCFGLILIIIGGFLLYKKYLRFSSPVIKLKNLGKN
ncbi:hypothetical protein CYY_005284 [Polysphondylium violaceum]|uniref:EGF-like domain-containing protein n=1 Tax=Polysphondylium violaceum TaxID=133409 RepID=A0A8J4PTJ7_9MYCE|nr:hypothetical protein CYY_005284 [Polysphondylium violaceum]